MKKSIILILFLVAVTNLTFAKSSKKEKVSESVPKDSLCFFQITEASTADDVKKVAKKYSEIAQTAEELSFQNLKIEGITYQNATFHFASDGTVDSIQTWLSQDTDPDLIDQKLLNSYSYNSALSRYTAQNGEYLTYNRMNGQYLFRYFFN
ncbi:MAG: hypothetical protein MJ188_00250 [Treponema sp.]|nr:hypothetical protein [Treponema sp.]